MLTAMKGERAGLKKRRERIPYKCWACGAHIEKTPDLFGRGRLVDGRKTRPRLLSPLDHREEVPPSTRG